MPEVSPPGAQASGGVTLATWITLARLALIVPFAILFFTGPLWLAGIVFAVAGLTDWLDGYVARSRGEVSALGTALDPIADKLLTIAALVLLCASGIVSGAGVVAALAIALREVLVGGLREAVAGRAVKLPVTFLAKIKTTVQFAAFFVLIVSGGAGAFSTVGDILLWVAAALTVWTGYQYTSTAVRALV